MKKEESNESKILRLEAAQDYIRSMLYIHLGEPSFYTVEDHIRTLKLVQQIVCGQFEFIPHAPEEEEDAPEQIQVFDEDAKIWTTVSHHELDTLVKTKSCGQFKTRFLTESKAFEGNR